MQKSFLFQVDNYKQKIISQSRWLFFIFG